MANSGDRQLNAVMVQSEKGGGLLLNLNNWIDTTISTTPEKTDPNWNAQTLFQPITLNPSTSTSSSARSICIAGGITLCPE